MAPRAGWLIPFLSLLLCAEAAPAIEIPKKAAGRWHFTFQTEPAFEISVIFRRDETGDKTRLLVRLPSGRFELFSEQDATGRITFESVKELETGTIFERRLYLPGPLLPKGCTKVSTDGCLEFRGARGQHRTTLAAFSGETAETERRAVKAVLAPGLDASIQRLVQAFPRSHEFDAYGDDFLYLVWPQAKRQSPVEKAERGPGCAFDASFGYPCSDVDRKREEARFPKK